MLSSDSEDEDAELKCLGIFTEGGTRSTPNHFAFSALPTDSQMAQKRARKQIKLEAKNVKIE